MSNVKKLAVGFINDICDKDYSAAQKGLAKIVNEKIKNRIKKAAIAKEQE